MAVHQHVNPEVAGSNPTLVSLSLFNRRSSKINPVSFPGGLLLDNIYFLIDVSFPGKGAESKRVQVALCLKKTK